MNIDEKLKERIKKELKRAWLSYFDGKGSYIEGEESYYMGVAVGEDNMAGTVGMSKEERRGIYEEVKEKVKK